MTTLKKNFEFKRVINKGKCINGEYIVMYVFPNRLKTLRVGFAISKKAGKAHDRNRIRRLIKENFRLIEEKFLSNADIVFLWKNKVSADDIDFYKIKEDLIKLNRRFLQREKNEKTGLKVN